MNNINPNNFSGATVTIVGNAAGPYEVKEFSNGGSQAQLSIGVGKGYKDKSTGEWKDTGTDWYTLTAQTDYAAANWPNVEKGDKVRVDESRLELKGYPKNDGTVGVEALLKYGTLVIIEKKGNSAPADKPW